MLSNEAEKRKNDISRDKIFYYFEVVNQKDNK